MADEQLLGYIKQSQVLGKTTEEIKNELIKVGWLQATIDEALAQNQPQPQTPTPTQAPTQLPPSTPQKSAETITIAPKETIQTKIVALWFIIVAVIGILIGLFNWAALFPSFSIFSYDSLFPYLYTVVLFLNGAFLIPYSIILIKVSAGIHKLDQEAYRTAKVDFIWLYIMGILVAILYVSSGSLIYLLSLPVGIILNTVLYLMLRSQKSLFVNKAIKPLKIKLLIVISLISLTVISSFFLEKGLVSYKKQQASKTIKRIMDEQKKQNPEPTITQWERYINDQYKFSLDVPAGWFRKEYGIDETEEGKAIVAFSSKQMLDFWYIEDPYFFITIFPVTDQVNYSLYQIYISKITTMPALYQKGLLGGIEGVWRTNVIEAEYNGFVYELSLKETYNDKLERDHTEISKKILSSFKFR